MRKVTVSRLRERYAQTVLTLRITHTHTHTHTYIYIYKHFISFEKQKIIIKLGGVENTLIKILWL